MSMACCSGKFNSTVLLVTRAKPTVSQVFCQAGSTYSRRIDEKLETLKNNPFDPSLDIKKVVGTNTCRLRVGTYRIIYQLQHDELIILMMALDSRGDVYKT